MLWVEHVSKEEVLKTNGNWKNTHKIKSKIVGISGKHNEERNLGKFGTHRQCQIYID